MLDPILNEQELATLLKVPAETVAALIADINFPRFYLDGQVRFLLARVLAWFDARDGQEAIPARVAVAAPPPPPKPTRAPSRLPTAKPGEYPWVAAEALDALASGAADSGRNLDRLKLRDALLELNDALLGALARHSGGRLHPHYDEKSRTSPWRLDVGSDQRIDAISIAWGTGEHAPPQFSDRPHIAVELSKCELRIALDTAQRTFSPPLDPAGIEALADFGITAECGADQTQPTRFVKVYLLPDPAPSVAAIVEVCEPDLEQLVPLWVRLV